MGTKTDDTLSGSVGGRLKPNPCLKVFSCCETFDFSHLGFHIIPHKCVTETSAKWKTLIPSSVCRSKPSWSRTFLFSILWHKYSAVTCSSICLQVANVKHFSVFSLPNNPWPSLRQPQPGDEAYSWGRPWACPPEPLLWRAGCEPLFCSAFIFVLYLFYNTLHICSLACDYSI